MNDIPTATKRMERVKIECCPECNGYGFVRVAEDENSISAKTCSACRGSGLVAKLATNADRIRGMSDEELLHYLNTRGCPSENHSNCFEMSCKHCWEKWLKQPAEGE